MGVKNEPLAWDAAENRARAEIAKNVETYTAYLMRDYAASTNAGDFSKSTEEQLVERAIKTFSATTLRGVRPIDRYKDEDTYTYYVLAKLSLEDMQQNVGAIPRSRRGSSRSCQGECRAVYLMNWKRGSETRRKTSALGGKSIKSQTPNHENPLQFMIRQCLFDIGYGFKESNRSIHYPLWIRNLPLAPVGGGSDPNEEVFSQAQALNSDK